MEPFCANSPELDPAASRYRSGIQESALAPSTPTPPPGLVVIGYGNELRSDDGLGPRLARRIEEQSWPGLHVVIRHQLTLELGALISPARAVVFLDASVDSERVLLRPLAASPGEPSLGHSIQPGDLLAVVTGLYGPCPPAWWITMPAFDLGCGDQLSERAEASEADGFKLFERLWRMLRVESWESQKDNLPAWPVR
jgi:hydrogenase maturation protease